MKIDLDWIQEELDAGNTVELECVDEKGLLSEYTDHNKELLRSVLTVEEIKNHAIYIKNCEIGIVESEYKHFRIKQYPTFDDLIDVAVRAAKDGLLEINKLNKDFITSKLLGNHDFSFLTSYRHKPQNFEKDILGINSLYTETFVIESEEDYNSLKGDANIKLLNGEVIKRIINYSACTPEFSDADGRVVRLSYLTLKGATVTQKRG